MARRRNNLILGASYGSLLGAKLALAGHDVRLVCLPEEARLINDEGARVRLPVRALGRTVELNTREMAGDVSASGASDAKPAEYDLVVLAMQEPQYRAPEVRALLEAVAEARVPCMSLMNMPPLTYLKRIPGLDTDSLRDSYCDASVWDRFDPSLMTLCSADPQGFRPPGEKVNVLQVALPTNFKSARFFSDEHTAILEQLADDIQAIRYPVEDGEVELPVKLRVYDSVFTPLAKWSMSIVGNYRCVQKSGMRSINEAVHADLEESLAIYEWVIDLCVSLGADREDMVPFERYAKAAQSLVKPSSAARGLAAGVPRIERVDRLVQSIAASKGMRMDAVDELVSLVDSWERRNQG
jgi:hypothetical protein